MDGMEIAPCGMHGAGVFDGSRAIVETLGEHPDRTEGLAMDDRESRIRKRAYRLWEQDGWPTGMEAEHWARAERELASDGDEPNSVVEGAAQAVSQPASAAKRPAVRSKPRAVKIAAAPIEGSAISGPGSTEAFAAAAPVAQAATQSASAGKRPAVRSKSRAAKGAGATSTRARTKPPK